MKKIFLLGLALVLLFTTGCTKTAGKYKEGTYFGADSSGYTAVVVVDENGVIDSVFLDAAYVVYGSDGKCTVDGRNHCIATTKQALGDAYGMKAASPIGKEWYEQANAFAAKVIKEQGLGFVIWTDEEKTTTDAVAGVTMGVDGMYNAINQTLTQAAK